MAWPGIEDEGDAGLGEFLRVLQHALVTVGADDADGHAGDVLHVVLVAAHHRAGVEGGDLVVVQVGGDEGLGGEQLVDHLDPVQGDALFLEPLAVRAEVRRRWPSGSGRRRAA
jgi:hypothetical protein